LSAACQRPPLHIRAALVRLAGSARGGLVASTLATLAAPGRAASGLVALAMLAAVTTCSLLGGCSVAARGRAALQPLLTPRTPVLRPLEHPLVDAAAVALLDQLRDAGQRGDYRSASRRLLLSPLADGTNAWEASALGWALLRQAPTLLPAPWPTEPRSEPALQAWLRLELAQGRALDTELWLVQARGQTPTDCELVIVGGDHSWRSGPQTLAVPARDKRSWPLAADATLPLATLQAPGAEFLRELDGALWLESRDGRRGVDLRSGALTLGPLRSWAEWNMTWAERREGRTGLAKPVLAMLARDVRLELRTSDLPVGEGDVWSWWLARDGACAPLPLTRPTARTLVSLVAAPHRWGIEQGWLTLERDASGNATLALFAAPLRALPPADAGGAAARAVTAAARADLAASGGGPTICQAIPPRPAGDWPHDRTRESTGNRTGERAGERADNHGSTARRARGGFDPWFAWRLVHTGVLLARWDPRQGAVPEPGVTWSTHDGGTTWELTLPLPGARAALPAITPQDWARAWRTAIGGSSSTRSIGSVAGTDSTQALAASNTSPVDADDWLLGRLARGRVTPSSRGLRVEFDAPVPDLPARLACPRLALQDPTLSARFATHRFATLPRLDQLAARHADSASLALVEEADPLVRRTQFLLGETQILRPWEIALDDPLTRAPVAAGPAALGDSARWRAVREPDRCVALTCDPASPPQARQRLSQVLRRLSPVELLAIDDERMRPIGPITQEPLASDEQGDETMTEDAGEGATTGRPLEIELRLTPDVGAELARAAQRLAVLLAPLEIQVIVEATPAPPTEVGSAERNAPLTIHARLERVVLTAGEPLLRALELAGHVGAGGAARRTSQDSRASQDSQGAPQAQVSPESQAAAAPLGDPARLRAARSIEISLVRDGLAVPLWTEPGLALLDRHIVDEGPLVPGLPVLLQEAYLKLWRNLESRLESALTSGAMP
jgi:hypothetical protein